MGTNIERVAWTGDVPWRTLGVDLDSNCDARSALRVAKLDWEVKLLSSFAEYKGKRIKLPHQALMRMTDFAPLAVTGKQWNPIQNADALEFFCDFVKKNSLEMAFAGCLDVPGKTGGKIVYALAKMKRAFSLSKHDPVDTYVLFKNPHAYGNSAGLLATPMRVASKSTLAIPIGREKEISTRISHRKSFSAEEIKTQMNMIQVKIDDFEEKARLLASHRMSKADAEEYFRAVAPAAAGKGGKKAARGEMTRRASAIASLLETQPGADLSAGTWWQGFSAVTFAFDHVLGREDREAENDTQDELLNRRLHNSWFGWVQRDKLRALDLAVERASKSKGLAAAA